MNSGENVVGAMTRGDGPDPDRLLFVPSVSILPPLARSCSLSLC